MEADDEADSHLFSRYFKKEMIVVARTNGRPVITLPPPSPETIGTLMMPENRKRSLQDDFSPLKRRKTEEDSVELPTMSPVQVSVSITAPSNSHFEDATVENRSLKRSLINDGPRSPKRQKMEVLDSELQSRFQSICIPHAAVACGFVEALVRHHRLMSEQRELANLTEEREEEREAEESNQTVEDGDLFSPPVGEENTIRVRIPGQTEATCVDKRPRRMSSLPTIGPRQQRQEGSWGGRGLGTFGLGQQPRNANLPPRHPLSPPIRPPPEM